MLRVNRLAAAMDMIAAGTSAPMAMAANEKPANQEGNASRNSAGTAKWGAYRGKGAAETGEESTFDAMAMYPSSAMAPSRMEYAGSIAVLRRMTARPLEL